jgi:hypothetical protein
LQRDEYLAEMANLQTLNQDFDLSYWREDWTRRPRKDSAKEYRRTYATLRPIARIDLMGPNSRLPDAMAFDANGQAATVTKHPWLQTLANQWTADGGQRMSLTDRLTHLMELTPVGEFHLESPEVGTAAMMVDEAAQAALARKR